MVLPAPLGPVISTSSPDPTENVTSLKMELGPKDFATPTSLTTNSEGCAAGASEPLDAPFSFLGLPFPKAKPGLEACARADA